jgi:hypothetical protein
MQTVSLFDAKTHLSRLIEQISCDAMMVRYGEMVIAV